MTGEDRPAADEPTERNGSGVDVEETKETDASEAEETDASEAEGTDASEAEETDASEAEGTGDGSGFARMAVKRFAVIIVVAVVVAALVTGGILAALSDEPAPDPEFESFESAEIVSTGLPAEGAIEPTPDGPTEDGGTVVIDGSTDQRSDLGPMTEAFANVGYNVTRNGGSLVGSLDDADGLIIVDPRTEYTEAELDEIERFVDSGGHLVIFGEPNRFVLASGGLFGPQLSEVESGLAGVSSRFDVHFDTRYVYDQQRNDGNFRHVLVEPHPDASLPGESFADVEEAVLYTPTEVRSTGSGEPVLVTGPHARMSDSDTAREHTVALRDQRGNGSVLAVGDSRLISDDRYNVGDNDGFLAGVVEFVVSGESTPLAADSDQGSGDGSGGTGDGADDETNGSG